MAKGTLEVRISPQAKAAAQDRAKAQGYTVSEAVRRLLGLWVDGTIDLAALDRLGNLPTMEELQALAQALDRARKAAEGVTERLEDAITDIEAASNPLQAFMWKYGPLLEGRFTGPRPDLGEGSPTWRLFLQAGLLD